MLYDFCYFDKKIFKKILKICLENEIEDKNLRADILKKYPKMQEIYNYPDEAKGDLMPDVREVQQLSELLELQNIIS
nr:hypothetical protein [uncultured Campylobacter sp.]